MLPLPGKIVILPFSLIIILSCFWIKRLFGDTERCFVPFDNKSTNLRVIWEVKLTYFLRFWRVWPFDGFLFCLGQQLTFLHWFAASGSLRHFRAHGSWCTCLLESVGKADVLRGRDHVLHLLDCCASCLDRTSKFKRVIFAHFRALLIKTQLCVFCGNVSRSIQHVLHGKGARVFQHRPKVGVCILKLVVSAGRLFS